MRVQPSAVSCQESQKLRASAEGCAVAQRRQESTTGAEAPYTFAAVYAALKGRSSTVAHAGWMFPGAGRFGLSRQPSA
ncbi:MAG TPA: hypothetical protein VMT67_07970, partial [Terriglobales bacterium]|nr:hypothetical protein [Terriglobales bacterium]